MQCQCSSCFSLIFILGLLSMLMPLAIDMYLPSCHRLQKVLMLLLVRLR